MFKLKFVVFVFFIVITSLSAQKEIGRGNVSDFNRLIQEVYSDSTNDVILSNKQSINFYKGILNRIVFYESSSFPSQLDKIDLNNVYKIKDYNPNLEFSLPKDFKNFNPYKYKLNTYNKKTIYYYSENSNYIVGLLPSTQS